MDPGDPYVNVVLKWMNQNLDAALRQTYIITISPDPPSTVDSGTIFYTTTTSTQLTLLYDQDYTTSAWWLEAALEAVLQPKFISE